MDSRFKRVWDEKVTTLSRDRRGHRFSRWAVVSIPIQVCDPVPEGQTTIAQRFNVGTWMPAQPSPEGTAEIGPQLQRLGNREIRGPREQDVDVVRHAPNLDGIHSVLPGDAAQEGPESLAQFRCGKRPALLGAENTMEIRANVRHALIQPSL